MAYEAINLAGKLRKFSEHWSPRVIAELNDYQVKLARIKGEFVWHDHPDTDELFMVLEGEMAIEFRDGSVELRAGEMFIVPRGVEHRPSAEQECHILLLEPRGVSNTGSEVNEFTAAGDRWI